MPERHIVFVTGTRADYGKLKPLISTAAETAGIRVSVFVTGMHMLDLYGATWMEVKKSGVGELHPFINQNLNDSMDSILGKTVLGFSDFVKARKPDLIVVHGDRVETLACASVGALANVLVAHVEGGEFSGTVDGVIRHAVTKMSHIHLVANEEAVQILVQLGESRETIYQIGSPDIDVMNSLSLPSITEVRDHYDFDFDEYGVLIFHPVTTELDTMREQCDAVVSAAVQSALPFIVIFPNNDTGCEIILECYGRFSAHDRFKVFPSIRFESFLTVLKNSRLILGNSSAGIREAPHYGVPTVNVGSRQHGRLRPRSVIDVGADSLAVLAAIEAARKAPRSRSSSYGVGDSARQFGELLTEDSFWEAATQKSFVRRV